MNYELEELVPIVARLAEGYTSKASTSITYDRAQQLMSAVLYPGGGEFRAVCTDDRD